MPGACANAPMAQIGKAISTKTRRRRVRGADRPASPPDRQDPEGGRPSDPEPGRMQTAASGRRAASGQQHRSPAVAGAAERVNASITAGRHRLRHAVCGTRGPVDVRCSGVPGARPDGPTAGQRSRRGSDEDHDAGELETTLRESRRYHFEGCRGRRTGRSQAAARRDRSRRVQGPGQRRDRWAVKWRWLAGRAPAAVCAEARQSKQAPLGPVPAGVGADRAGGRPENPRGSIGPATGKSWHGRGAVPMAGRMLGPDGAGEGPRGGRGRPGAGEQASPDATTRFPGMSDPASRIM